MDESPITAHIDLSVTGGSLAGRLAGPDGPLEFSGWLGLIAAIDGLVPDTDPTPSTRAPEQETP